MASENPIHHDQTTQDSDHKANNDATQPKPVISPTIGAAETETEPPKKKCCNPCEEKKHWLDYLEVGLAGFGLIILTIYTIFTGYMMCANIKAADAAKSAADTAAKQERSWEVSQRPWIEISNPTIVQQPTIPPITPIVSTQPVLQDAPYNFEVTIKAYGSTPALRSYAKMNPRFVNVPGTTYPFLKGIPVPTLDSCSKTAEWEEGSSVYFPAGSYTLLSNGQVADSKDMRKLIAAQNALFWVGCVRYEDAFKRRYQSNFCFYWSATESPRGWYRCLGGNDLIEFPDN